MLGSDVVLRRLLLGAAAVAVLSVNCGGDSEQKDHDPDDGGEAGQQSPICFGSSCAARGGAAGRAGGTANGGSLATSGSAGQGGSAGSVAQSGQGGTNPAGGSNPVSGAGGESGRAGGGSSGTTGGSAGKAGAGSAGAAGTAGTAAGNAGTAGAASGLTVSRVAFYQATEVPLWEAGASVTDAVAPVVANRAGMLRVWLQPASGFAPRAVNAALTIATGGATAVLPVDKNVTGASTNADLASTLTFTLSASQVVEGTTLALAIDDEISGGRLVTWPATGTQALGAASTNGPFSLLLVPLVSSGFTPELTSEVVTRYQRHIEKLYPVPSVAIDVRLPLELDIDVQPDGSGWDQALDQLYELRGDDDPDPNTYYYGVLTPGNTLEDYCPEGCVVGLAAVAARSQEIYRGGIGTGFFESPSDTFTPETLEHEIGHALGRDHSPCDTGDGVDPDYPYDDGGIGRWGWDGTRLRNPSQDTDVMGYCVPVWVSDYTYAGLFERITYVNGLAARTHGGALARAARSRVRTLIVRSDGTLRWGREKWVRGAPGGEPLAVELLDATGSVLERVNASFAGLDHISGGFVTLPAEALARPGVAAVRVFDTSLVVP